MKIIKGFFITLGVIFFVLILMGLYIWFTDPFNIKPLLSSGVTIESVANTISGDTIKVDNIDKNPLLTEDQEATLETLGIDPADLPTEITPELTTCLTSKVGKTRANEIIQGSEPTTSDILKASACLN